MLWRRYRFAVLGSVPIGAVLGIVMNLALYLGGNPDYRDQGGWGAFIYTLAVGSVVGGANALAALVVGALAVLVFDRHLRCPARVRVTGGAVGAAAGAAALWLGAGVLDSFTSLNGGAWFFVFVLFAGIAAAVAFLAALFLLKRAERAWHAREFTKSDTS